MENKGAGVETHHHEAVAAVSEVTGLPGQGGLLYPNIGKDLRQSLTMEKNHNNGHFVKAAAVDSKSNKLKGIASSAIKKTRNGCIRTRSNMNVRVKHAEVVVAKKRSVSIGEVVDGKDKASPATENIVIVRVDLQLVKDLSKRDENPNKNPVYKKCISALEILITHLLYLLLEICLKLFFGLLAIFVAVKSWMILAWAIDKTGFTLTNNYCQPMFQFWFTMVVQTFYLMVLIHSLIGAGKPFFSYFKVSGLLSDLLLCLVFTYYLFMEFTFVKISSLEKFAPVENCLYSVVDSVDWFIDTCVLRLDVDQSWYTVDDKLIGFGRFMTILLAMWFCISISEWRGYWREAEQSELILKPSGIKLPEELSTGVNPETPRNFLCTFLKYFVNDMIELGLIVLYFGGCIHLVRAMNVQRATYTFWISITFEITFFLGVIKGICSYMCGRSDYRHWYWKIEGKKRSNETVIMILLQLMTFMYADSLHCPREDGRTDMSWAYTFGNYYYCPIIYCFTYFIATLFSVYYCEAITHSNGIISAAVTRSKV